MSTEQHKDPPSPPATLPSSSFLCRLEAGGKKEPHGAGICDAAGRAAALWPRCRSDGAEAALQDRSSLAMHWGNTTFLQFTPVHQETLPSFFLISLPCGTAASTTFRPHIGVNLPFGAQHVVLPPAWPMLLNGLILLFLSFMLMFAQRWVMLLTPAHHSCKKSWKEMHEMCSSEDLG